MLENDVQNLTTTKTSDVDENDLSEDDSEEEESLGKVLTKNGKEIDRKSAGNVKRSKEEIKADDEPENEFGYTDSEWNLFAFILALKCATSKHKHLFNIFRENKKAIWTTWKHYPSEDKSIE